MVAAGGQEALAHPDEEMMAARHILLAAVACVAIASCSHGSASSTPTPAPTRPAAAQPANEQPVTLAPRRVPPSRDSLEKLRAVYVAQIMGQIAGRENQPAEQVFKNIQVLKGITAAELVTKMEKEYATPLSWNCTNCHRLAPQGNWASDTSNDKRRARFMQQMTNDINLVELPKLYPKDTPKVTCATCHRGYNEPPPPEYMIPERGKPGGLPLPPARGQSGPPPAAKPPGA
jgi:Photosynthetic reaction centre cytochrome C subunit